jgi:hypothetical protein
MRLKWFLMLLAITVFVLGACSSLSTEPVIQPTAAPTGTLGTPTPRETATSAPEATASPSPSPLPQETVAPTPTISEQDEAFRVRFHPDWALYVGDQVSIEVIAPTLLELSESRVSVRVTAPVELQLGEGGFGAFGIGGRSQATFIWAWDTRELDPGIYAVQFQVEPQGTTWEELVELRPQEAMIPPEPWASWSRAESDCCIIHYVTGTEGERDLEWLIEAADRQALLAAQRMGTDFNEPVEITILPRVLGHGGFAGREISVSYLDRNYAGSEFEMVLHHEMIHILDGRLGGALRPSILVEGLAVYLSGGHFKPEPLMQRAAALLEIPAEGEGDESVWYIPLRELADEFYPAQHEIGYLQAGAMVQYMVERWGWDAYSNFYRDIQPQENGTPSNAIEDALLRYFDMTLDQLEQDFLEVLRHELVTAEHIEDVRLTVVYYDTLRRYQRLMDSSAYFRTAWLLSNEEMRSRGIVADYVRRPMNPENIALEMLFIGAQEHFASGRYAETQRVLDSINAALDILIVEETEAALAPR